MEVNQQVSFDDTSVAFSAKSDKELKKMYWIFGAMNSNLLVNAGTFFIKTALSLGLPVKGLIKSTLFQQFCGGESIWDCRETSQALARFNVGIILDYSVEGGELEEGFDATLQEILNTIEKASIPPANPFCVFKMSGLASNDLLQRKQLGTPLSPDETGAWHRVKDRVDKICKAGYQNDLRILIDAEESWIQKPIDKIAYDMMAKYNKERAIIYNTYQMYCKDVFAQLKTAFHYAVANNYNMGVKLVRGAYLEQERERAEKMNYPDPTQPTKEATDKDFNLALKFCIENKQRIALCCGSHNEDSNHYLTILMNKYGLKNDDPTVYFSQLYGMSDNISFNLAKAGYNVAKYLPYGPLKSVIPYLFRRAEENTSIAGQSSREFGLIKKELARRKALK